MNDISITNYRERAPWPLRLVCALIPGLCSALALWLWLAVATTPVHADTLCVKPGGGDGCLTSINAALAAAQESDTIQVAAGIYNENVLISQTVTLQGGWSLDFSVRNLDTFSSTIHPLDNTKSVVAIQGQFADPAAVAPTLEGFVISGGRAHLGSNHGGGLQIRDSNALVISNTIQDNTAFFLGGGVWVQRGAPVLQGNNIMNNLSLGLGQDAHGGGVQLENTQATLLDNLIASNVVSGTQAYGGGLEISSTGAGHVTLMRNQFISNTASIDPTDSGFGGGIAVINGGVFLGDSRLFSNTATANGGGLFIDTNGVISLTNITLIANLAAQDGGAIHNSGLISLTNTTVSGNSASGVGGGIAVSSGQVFLEQSSLISNTAATSGGGLYSNGQFAAIRDSLIISNTATADGGGLFIDTAGVISLTNSALIANLAAQDGGGIHNSGLISLTNTTLSGNNASAMGGGIANFDMVNLVNVTVSDNSGSGAGLFNSNVVNTRNSLIALNQGDNCQGAALFSQGHNLEDGFTCALGQPTDMPNTSPSMNQLGENGGSTPTHALNADSPAIDKGDNSACPPTDQRGGPRPVDGDGDGQAVCDIGAFEYGAIRQIYLPIVMRE